MVEGCEDAFDDCEAGMQVTEIAPTHCSSCFAQKPGSRHVDFDAAWDGPVINEGEKNSPVFVSIDELIICEDCVREAGALMGLKPAGRIEAEKAEAEDRARELAERLAGAVDHIARLEEAHASAGRLADRLAAPGRASSPTQRRKRAPAAQDEKAAA